MRKKIGILVCLLWGTVSAFAVNYQPCGGASFGSTSAYVSTRQTSYVHHTPYTVHQSASAISAANFSTLNSEGGACYMPGRNNVSPGPRKAYEPDIAIGEGVWESPVGDIPFILMAIMLALYGIWKKKCKKVQKNVLFH